MAQITDNRPLTPEMLTAAGWKEDKNDGFKIVNDTNDYKNYIRISMYKDLNDEDGCGFMTAILRKYANSSEYHVIFEVNRNKGDIIRTNFKRALSVGEFNTLLDIVGLQKFKIK